jgi:hypothetical protein
MKIWVVILIVLAMGLIVFLWRRRERFSSGAIQPTCPGEFILAGTRCRLDGVDVQEDGQCPPGTVMNEEGMCQGQADPVCGEGYTLTIEDGVAMCEPNIRPVELTDEENQARQNAATQPQCPAGFTRDFTMPIDTLRCLRDTGVAPVSGQCPPNSIADEVFFENVGFRFTCVEYDPPVPGQIRPVEPTVEPAAPPPVEPAAPPPVEPAAPPPVEPTLAPPPTITPETILPPPTLREIVFQPKLIGTPGGPIVPADTRIRSLLGGLFSPAESRPEPRPSEYTL